MNTHRLRELDLLRGLSVIAMILVITPGAWGQNYHWLNHADWEGIVFADMIFPTFLFCVGFAIPLSITSKIERGYSIRLLYWQIALRTFLLILLGLFINLSRNFDIATLRIPGILQRIALCYAAVSFLLLFLHQYRDNNNAKNILNIKISVLILIAVSILFIYWALFYFVPVPGYGSNQFTSFGSWSSYVDQKVFGIAHMWVWGQTNGVVSYDPDGLLSSLPACTNVIAGAILALLYQQKSPYFTKITLAVIAIMLISSGYLIQNFSPIIKKLWTSSFALISIGVSILLYVCFSVLKSFKVFHSPFNPLHVFGANALLAFIISFLCLMWWLNIPIIDADNKQLSIRDMGFQFYSRFITSPPMASLIFGLSFSSVLYGLLVFFHIKNWYLKL